MRCAQKDSARELQQAHPFGGPFGRSAANACQGESTRPRLSEGVNEIHATNDPTAHAEVVAIRAAAAKLGNERLDGCDLYVTLEPCAMCAGAIAHARIARLYYGADDPKGGAVAHGPRLFAQPTVHHRPEIYEGIGAGEAAGLLRDFFAARR